MLGSALGGPPTPDIVEPAPAPVYPIAIVCVEKPGDTDARPCQSWCEHRAVSHVLRLMRIESVDVSVRYEWREVHCLDYLAERTPV